ncbi:MAG: DUF4340 domain-containing protein, partial [Bacteroidia bacterium]|nr:DUF4340 domain-containing protein [Bacteroidia bacterium]
SCTLVRKSSGWYVRQGDTIFKALDAKVQSFLTTVYRIQVREPVAEQARKTAFGDLKTARVRVEIRLRDGRKKIYDVGGATPDGGGTYALLDGASDPYIVETPGHHGYLRPQYPADAHVWREKVIFDIPPHAVIEIKNEHPVADSAFHLIKTERGWTLADGAPTDTAAVRHYLRAFGKVYAQDELSLGAPQLADSIRRQKTDRAFVVRYRVGERTETLTLRLFYRPERGSSFYGAVEGRPELFIVQRFVFDKFLARRDFFVLKNRR